MPDDLDAPALQAAIDEIEGTGVPPHLVERLREMVDFHGRFVPDNIQTYPDDPGQVSIVFRSRQAENWPILMTHGYMQPHLGPLIMRYFGRVHPMPEYP